MTEKNAADKPAKAPAKKPAAKRTTSRPTSKIIRNLRNAPVHLRLGSQNNIYRIELKPRGLAGDTHTVPADLTQEHTFISAHGHLFEIITSAEAAKIEYPRVGYLTNERTEVIRDQDATLASQPSWDGKGLTPNVAKERLAGEAPRRAEVPGSQQYRSPGDVDGVGPTKLVVERTSQPNQ